MHPPLIHRRLCAIEPMSQRDVDAVLANARALQRFARAGAPPLLLRGKNFALMAESADGGDAALFLAAAAEMGAQVAHLRPSLSELSTPQEVESTARMLGRLYDAVECQGIAPALVAQVGHDAGVPVYDALASPQHPTSRLADALGHDTSPADNRRFVLQAVLLRAVA